MKNFSFFLIFCLWSCISYGQIAVNGQCLMKGTAGLWWQTQDAAGEFEVSRSTDGVQFTVIGETAEKEFIDIHGVQDVAAVFFYRVKNLKKSRSVGQAVVGNSCNLMKYGDFEHDAIGSAYPLAVPSLGGNRELRRKVTRRIVQEGRNGSRALQISIPKGECLVVRNTSRQFRIVPEHRYVVQGWVKGIDGGTGGLGGHIRTAEHKMCRGYRVPTFATNKISEKDGWMLYHQDLKVASDAAFIYVWAICWETRGVTLFDDMELRDCRLEIIEQAGDGAAEGNARLQELKKKLENPRQSIQSYMSLVTEYADSLRKEKKDDHWQRLMRLK